MQMPTQQMQAVLDAYAALGPLPVENLNADQARVVPLLDRAAMSVYGQHFTNRSLMQNPLPVGKIQHLLIPGRKSDLVARVYTPQGRMPSEGWPCVVYLHGGGWVIANLDTYDASCRAICEGAECIVVSVHYRQAPEHQWPAAAQDAFAAYEWILQNARKIGGNSEKVAIAGESAGGNLAAVVTLLCKEKMVQLPIHQALVYPVTNLYDGHESVSAKENADAKPLNKAMLEWFYNKYIPFGVDRRDPMVSPFFAADLSGLPPATVILAEIDPLRSQGEAYAHKLNHEGVPVHLKTFKGVTHEFFGLAGLVDEATEAVKLVCKDLQTAFKYQKLKRAA